MSPNAIGEISSIICALVWASAMVLFKKAGESVNPFSLNIFKNTLGILLLVPTVLLTGGNLWPVVPAWTWLVLGVSGLLGIAIADTLFFICLNRLGANMAALINCLYIPFIMLMAFLLFGESTGLITIFGAALIIASITIASLEPVRPGIRPRDFAVGLLCGVISIFCVALGVLLLKKPLLGHPAVLETTPLVWLTLVRFIAGTLPLLPVVFFFKPLRSALTCLRPSKLWRVMIPGAFLGSYLSMIMWLIGWKYMTHSGAVAVLNQLNLVFVMILAAIFLGERINARKIVAILLAVAGGIITVMAG